MSFEVTVTPTVYNVEVEVNPSVQPFDVQVITQQDLADLVDEAKQYAEDAEDSADSASASASSASASASASASSANSASASASSASGSANTATTQAGIATTQAGIATTQAGIATTKAQEANQSASDALASEQASAQSASDALQSEQNALASEQASALSEANALASEQSASASASTATAQAGIATTQAGIATAAAASIVPVTIGTPANGLSIDSNQVLSIGLASGSTNGALSSTDWSTFNAKQPAIGYTPENVANKAINLTSPDDTKYPTTLAVSTALAGKQNALTNPITGTGASGQVAFWSGTGTQTGDSGLVWNNTFKTLGVGTPALINIGINNAKTLTGGIFSASYQALGQIQSDVTNTAFGFYSGIGGSSTLNISNINHFTADQGIFVSGALVGIHTGFRVNNLSTGNDVRGISLGISSGANRWNLYASGTASNYLAGNLLINTTTDAGFRLDVNGTARVQGALSVNTATIGNLSNNGTLLVQASTLSEWFSVGVIGSGVVGFNRAGGYTLHANAIFIARMNLGSLSASSHILSLQGVSGQTGDLLRIDATNSTTNGSTVLVKASGSVIIGSPTEISSSILTLESTTRGFLPPRMTSAQRDAIASPATGLVVYNTTDNRLSVYNGTAWVNLATV
jgi:hypothetical protein